MSKWFSNEEWSLDVTKKLQARAIESSKKRIKSLNVARHIRLEELYISADMEAEKEFLKHKHNSLFIAGIMIYLGEGDKKFENGQIRVSNTDSQLIKIFRNFLIKFSSYSLENIKGWILIYPDLNPIRCINYWSNETGILKGNFIKPTVIQGRHKTNRLSYGTCTIYFASKYFKKKMLKWIELFKKELIKL